MINGDGLDESMSKMASPLTPLTPLTSFLFFHLIILKKFSYFCLQNFDKKP